MGQPLASEALLTPEEVGDRLGVGRATVYRYIADGRLDSIRLGPGHSSPLRVPSSSLAAFLRGARDRQVERRSIRA